MASDSASKLATQQSIKAYVDSQIGANNELSEVLSNGNTTGGTDIAVSTGDDITFADSSKAIFGAGSDLQIYHDGSASYIDELGTGDLYIRSNGNNLRLQSYGGENFLRAVNNGTVELFYDNAKKLQTTSTGIDVTGSVVSDGATIAGTLELDSNNFDHTAATPQYNMIESDVVGNNTQFLQTAGDLRIRTVDDSLANPVERLRIDHATGDISFYEDTGTTAKLSWSASNERLGLTGSDYQFYIQQGSNEPWYQRAISNGNYALHLNGTGDVITVDTSGNVGIGTSSPSFELTAKGSANQAFLSTEDSTGTYKAIYGSDSAVGAGAVFGSLTNHPAIIRTNNTEAMRIDSAGNVGIGESSPVNLSDYVGLTLSDTTGGFIRFKNDAGTQAAQITASASSLQIETIAATPIIFYTNSSEAMRIDSSGNLLLNETSVSGNAEKFRLTSGGTSSTTAAALFNNSAGTELFSVRSDGAFRTGSAAASPYNNTAAVTANLFVNTDGTLVRATSSRRYKKDIVDARFGLSDLLNLRPVNYKGINSEVDEDIVYGGLIAEEVHDAGLTEFVEYNKENQPDALRYQHMVSLCIKAIQEQQDLIESLTARIAALEGAN